MRQLTNSCSMRGRVFSASAPQASGVVGSTRQPASVKSLALELALQLARGRPRPRRILIQEHQARGEARARA